jgi:putative DNA primase/helicase
MFVLYGSGANGKSTFLNTSRFLLGDYAQQTPADTLMVRDGNKSSNDLARLCGTRFVSAVETEEGRRLSEVLIKQLTGGDPIVARFLFHEFFEFIPQFKIFLATNHRPEIHGTDEAIWRRIRLIPFEITIPEKERDKNLESKLRSELSGILNWAVEGCLAWRRDGLQAPEEVKKATTAYRLEMDSLASFFEDRCLIDSSLRVPAKDLYAAYQAWCNDNAEREVSSTTFGKRLKERQFTPKKTGSVRWWYGIGLASTDPSDGTRLSNGTRLDTDSHAEEENSSYAKNNAGSRPNVSHASHFSEDSIDLAQLDDLWNSTETKVEVHS